MLPETWNFTLYILKHVCWTLYYGPLKAHQYNISQSQAVHKHSQAFTQTEGVTSRSSAFQVIKFCSPDICTTPLTCNRSLFSLLLICLLISQIMSNISVDLQQHGISRSSEQSKQVSAAVLMWKRHLCMLCRSVRRWYTSDAGKY